jgi:UPF0176 protein
VFDQRVAVGHGLEPGHYDQCYTCRHPLSAEDKLSPHYVQGVSCPHCIDHLTEEKRASATERQLQVELALKQGRAHIGEAQKKIS